ncbi:ribosome maturation factor RimM [Thermocrinis sp.]
MREFVVLGRVADTYGLNQELKVEAYLPPKDWRHIKRVFFKRRGGDYVPFEIERVRGHGKRWVILKLKGVDSQEVAKRFIGAKVFFPSEELPKRKEGEYYFFELEGLEVRSEKGKSLGKITGLMDIKDKVYLEIDEGRMLIPFTKEFVLRAEPKEGYLVVSSLLEEL